MRRGDLSSLPAPRVHVHWEVLFKDPEEGAWWRKHVWRVLIKLRWVPFIAMMLKPKLYAKGWLEKEAGKFQFELVVVGVKCLGDALRRVADEQQLWLADVGVHGSWETYAAVARMDTHLVELVHLEPGSLPLMFGVPVVPYVGWGHRFGL